MSETRPPPAETMPDYTEDLRGRTMLRGSWLMNMVCGLPFDSPMRRVPAPHEKLWQETKYLISTNKVPYNNHLAPAVRIGARIELLPALNIHADINAAELLHCLLNHPQPLFAPLLNRLRQWLAANPPPPSIHPTDAQVREWCGLEKARRHQEKDYCNRKEARRLCKVALPGAKDKQIDPAWRDAGPPFPRGKKTCIGA